MATRKKAAVAGILIVAGAAVAFALHARGQRLPVTTSSEKAYLLYSEGLNEESKLYFPEAAANYRAAIQEDPKFAMAYVRLASIMARARGLFEPEEIRAPLEKAMALRDRVTPRERRLIDIAETGLIKHDRSRVEELSLQFIREYPDDVAGYERLAMLYWEDPGHTEESRKYFLKVLQIDPNQAVAYNNLGYLFMGQGDFAKAEEYLKKYAFLAPDQANPHDSLAELYLRMGRIDDAVASAHRVIEVKPDFDHAYFLLGLAHEFRGDAARAQGFYEQGESFQGPWSAMFAGAMVRILLMQEKDAEAEARLQAMQQIERLRIDALCTRLVWLSMDGKWGEAAGIRSELKSEIARLQQLYPAMKIDERPGVQDMYKLLDALRLTGERQWKQAAVLFGEVITELDHSKGVDEMPTVFLTRYLWAKALIETGEVERARELLRETLRLAPGHELSRQTLASLPPTSK